MYGVLFCHQLTPDEWSRHHIRALGESLITITLASFAAVPLFTCQIKLYIVLNTDILSLYLYPVIQDTKSLLIDSGTKASRYVLEICVKL